MTDSGEPEVAVPSEGTCDSILQDLYIHLCNLIVESRIPGINERGYGDGCHCPPLIGPNTHKCDLSKLECQKHQRLIHHLLRAVRGNVFEIEVLMLPDCCTEPKLSERMQNKEYLLLERWSINCTYCKGQSNIEVSQLLRAVRSFLHFSQISAWLSSTKGKTPSNIYYWVKPSGDGSTTNFEREPEVHSFPVCKISEDLYGCITVQYPTRTQYVPIIPCSKHPPLRGYSFRTIEDTDLCPNIPLNPQLVRQLQITCDTTQSTPKDFVPEPATLLLTPVSLLKTFSTKVSDGNICNRILKHSNCQTDLINASDITLDLSKSKNIDVISKAQTAFVVCNYTANCSKVQSQENVCFRKRQLAMHLHKAGLKLRKLNTDISSPGYEIISNSLPPSSDVHNLTTERVSSKEECCDVSFQIPNAISVSRKDCQSESNSSTSPDQDMVCNNRSSRKHNKYLRKRRTTSKRNLNDVNADQTSILPHQNVKSNTYSPPQLFNNACSSESNQKVIPTIQNVITSHMKTIPALVNPVSNSEFEKNCNQSYLDHFVGHLNRAPDIEPNFQEKDTNSLSCAVVSAKEEEMVEQDIVLNNLDSKIHVRKRKRVSHNDFSNTANPELKLNISSPNFLQSISKEPVCASEFNNNKRCKTTNECKYALCKNFVLPSSLKSKPDGVEKCKQNFPLDLSECEKECSSNIKLSHLNNITKNKHTVFEEDPASKSTSVHEGEKSEFVRNIPNSTSSCEVKESMKGNLPYKNKRNIFLNRLTNAFSKSRSFLFCKNAVHKANLIIGRNKSRTLKRKSLIKSLKVTSRRNSADLKSLDFSNSINFDCSNKEKMINVEAAYELFENKNTAHKIQKKACKTDLKRVLKHSVTKQLKRDKISEVKNGHCISKKNKKVQKDNREHKYRSKNQCVNSEYTKDIQLSDSSAEIVDNRLLCIRSKAASTSISKEFSNNNNLEGNTQELLQEDPLQPMINGIDRSSISQNCGTISKPMATSHQDRIDINTASRIAPNDYRALSRQIPFENYGDFPRFTERFPKSRKLLVNFEESLLKECLPPVKSVTGFYVKIGASGGFCPSQLIMPASVNFYELSSSNQGTTPYVAHVDLEGVEYALPRKGSVQVALFNPTETLVKMFILPYDMTEMPPKCHTFIRQKTYYLPLDASEDSPQICPKWLRFIIHLNIASTETGRIYLYKDMKMVVLNRTNDDTATELNQDSRELRAFTLSPVNPTFSSI